MQNGITLDIAIPETLPLVVADARSLKQALINLVSNAVRVMGEGGHVLVAAEADDKGAVTLKVTDTGVGMSHGEVQLALQPFGQVTAHAPRGRPGAGLGLPVAKALAEANRAAFDIVSEPERGTTVAMKFPPALAS
jgi:signal transduction histidine kinase